MAAATANFRNQHAGIIELVRRFEATLIPARLAADATEARSLLGSLTGKLMVHLAMEDNSLYPRLLAHSDATVRRTAQKFSEECPASSRASRRWRKPGPSPRSAAIPRASAPTCGNFSARWATVYGARTTTSTPLSIGSASA